MEEGCSATEISFIWHKNTIGYLLIKDNLAAVILKSFRSFSAGFPSHEQELGWKWSREDTTDAQMDTGTTG